MKRLDFDSFFFFIVSSSFVSFFLNKSTTKGYTLPKRKK